MRTFLIEKVYGFNPWNSDGNLALYVPDDTPVFNDGKTIGDLLVDKGTKYKELMSFLQYVFVGDNAFGKNLRVCKKINGRYSVGGCDCAIILARWIHDTSSNTNTFDLVFKTMELCNFFISLTDMNYDKRAVLNYIRNPQNYSYPSKMMKGMVRTPSNDEICDSTDLVIKKIQEYQKFCRYYETFCDILPYDNRYQGTDDSLCDIRNFFPLSKRAELVSLFDYNSYCENDEQGQFPVKYCNIKVFRHGDYYICVYSDIEDTVVNRHGPFEFNCIDTMDQFVDKIVVCKMTEFDPVEYFRTKVQDRFVNKILAVRFFGVFENFKQNIISYYQKEAEDYM